jgi:hypothetical protein
MYRRTFLLSSSKVLRTFPVQKLLRRCPALWAGYLSHKPLSSIYFILVRALFRQTPLNYVREILEQKRLAKGKPLAQTGKVLGLPECGILWEFLRKK